jgi:hypothetical protein
MTGTRSDLGPRIRRERGDVVVDRLATGTAGGEVRRARVCDPLTAIAAAGGLGDAHDAARRILAAETLRDMTAQAAGIRAEQGERVDGGGGGLWPQERGFAAKIALARVWLAVHDADAPVLRWVVLCQTHDMQHAGTLAGYARHFRTCQKRAAARLRSGLDTISANT